MAVSPFFLADDRPLVAEMSRVQRLRRLAEANAARMPDVASRLDRYATQYPWMEAGVSLSLAQSGIEPDQPVAQFAAQGSVYAQRYRGVGGFQVGQEVDPAVLASDKPMYIAPEKGTGPSRASELFGGLMDGLGQSFSAQQQAGETLAQGTREATVLGPGDVSYQEAAAVDQRADQTITRPAVRAAGVVMDTPYQLLQANYRTVFRNNPDASWLSRIPTGPAQWNQTTLVQTANTFAEGGTVDLGTGYFSDPEGATEQRRRRELLRYGQVGGSAITPGRQLVGLVFEPGTAPYNTLSGVVDAAVAVVGDPLNLATGVGTGARGINAAGDAAAAGRAARLVDVSDDAASLTDDLVRAADGTLTQATRADDLPEVFAVGGDGTATRSVLLDPGDPGNVSPIASEAGITDHVTETMARRRAAGGIDGVRRFTNPGQVTAWLNSPTGTAIQEWFAGQGSAYDIWAASGRRFDGQTAAALRDAGTVDEVRTVLDAQMGVTVNDPLRIRPPSSSRWGYDVPGSQVDVDDLEDAMLQFERSARNAKVDDDVLREGFDQLLNATGREGRMTAFTDLFAHVKQDLIDTYGLHERDADFVTRMWDQQRAASAYAADRLGQNAWTPGMLVEDGVNPAAHTAAPLLDSEMINGPVPLPDFRALRRATSGAVVTVPFGGNKVNVSRLLLEQGGLSRQGGWGALVGRPSEAVQNRAVGILDDLEPIGTRGLVDNPLAAEGARTARADTNAMREAMGQQRFFGRNPEEYRLLWDGLLGFTTFVFKPAALLRPAWMTRVVLMDEQARRAASGMDNLASHPVASVLWATKKRGGVTPGGGSWDDVPEYTRSLYEDAGGPFLDMMNSGQRRITDQTVVTAADPQYARGVADRLATIHASVVGRNTARSQNLDDAFRWYFDGEHVPWAGKLDDAGSPVLLTEDGVSVRQQMSEAGGDWSALADNPDAARRHLEVVEEQIRLYTGGDDELLDAVRTGEFRGKPMIRRAEGAGPDDPGVLNDDFVDELSRRLSDEGGGIPTAMPDQVRVSTPRYMRDGHPAATAYNAVIRNAFAWLGSKPSNYLNRSPVFREGWAAEMTRLIPWMDADSQVRWLSYAEGEGNLGRGFVREIKATARAGAGDLDFDTADALARSHALGNVEDLLYSAHKHGQAADALRLAFPFGEAWKEMITTWGTLLTQRPQNIRTLQHGLQSANQGFFQENQWGESVFSYPLAGPVTEFVTGAGAGPGTPMPLTGRAQGLSMATEVLPGLGPVAQIPASWFIPDQPKWDWLAEQVTPYGRTEAVSDLVVPRWLQRVATGVNNYPGDAAWQQAARFMSSWMVSGEAQRTYNGTVMDTMTYFASTGEYQQTRAGFARLAEDAKRDAASLYIMRGLTQSTAPSAPSPDFQVLVEGENGEPAAEAASSAVVYADFRAMQEEDPETATGRFLEKYGEDAFLVMQSSSRTVSVGAPVTAEGIQWVQDNPDMQERFPLVYGLFAPSQGEFDYRAYISQFTDGSREQLTPEQFAAMGNNLVGGYLYRQARDEALQMAAEAGRSSITENQRLWLKDYRQQLMEEHPGYDPEGVPGVSSTASTAQLVRQVIEAANDPVVLSTDAGRGLNRYLRLRDQVAEQARYYTGDPESFQGRQMFAAQRAWLRDQADAVIRDHPAFAEVWDRVLSRELDEDLEEAAAA